jgi:hypothetical protein
LQPLVLHNQLSSSIKPAECGCTKPEYNQSPVLKGQKGSIKVTYTAPFEGAFKKRVSIKFAGEKAVTELVLEGEVVS